MEDRTADLASNDIEIMLLTRPDCHLCNEARTSLGALLTQFGLEFTEVSAASNPELAESFSEEIPVLLINGVQRDFWSLDIPRIRGILRSMGATETVGGERSAGTAETVSAVEPGAHGARDEDWQ